MKTIPLPKTMTVEEVKKDKVAKIIIEPCFSGYGMTLGNALRRVMLSSLPGGAVTAVKIDGVQHEFSTLENVSEDVVDIILNLKQLKVKVHSDEPVVLKLSAKGEGPVTSDDIESSSDAEITDKKIHIATLNSKEAKLNMEITVAKGVGYEPVEEKETQPEIGVILVDSIFTPVLNVGLKVEETRVGKRTDFDKIILDIETDGSISPEEAVKKAAEILTSQFAWIMEGGAQEVEEVELEAEVKKIEKPEKEEEKEEESEKNVEKSEKKVKIGEAVDESSKDEEKTEDKKEE